MDEVYEAQRPPSEDKDVVKKDDEFDITESTREQAVETGPEPDLELEPELGPELKPEFETEREPEDELDPKPDHEPVLKLKSELKSEPQPEPEPERKPAVVQETPVDLSSQMIVNTRDVAVSEGPVTRYLPEHKKPDAALTFPEKLMKLMRFAENQDDDFSVAWMDDGKSFIIRKPEEFTRNIVPRFFKATKFSSFTRKLYRWGFRQVNRGIGPDDPIIFGNENFVREDAESMTKMRSITAAATRKEEEKNAKNPSLMYGSAAGGIAGFKHPLDGGGMFDDHTHKRLMMEHMYHHNKPGMMTGPGPAFNSQPSNMNRGYYGSQVIGSNNMMGLSNALLPGMGMPQNQMMHQSSHNAGAGMGMGSHNYDLLSYQSGQMHPYQHQQPMNHPQGQYPTLGMSNGQFALQSQGLAGGGMSLNHPGVVGSVNSGVMGGPQPHNLHQSSSNTNSNSNNSSLMHAVSQQSPPPLSHQPLQSPQQQPSQQIQQQQQPQQVQSQSAVPFNVQSGTGVPATPQQGNQNQFQNQSNPADIVNAAIAALRYNN